MARAIIPKNWRDGAIRSRADTGDIRLRGIGGSEMPMILGVSSWGTAADVWMRKTGRFEDGFHEMPTVESGPAYWGTVVEPLLVREYAMAKETICYGSWWGSAAIFRPDGSVTAIPAKHWAHDLVSLPVQHPEHEWMLANIDAIISDPKGTDLKGILDGKTAMIFKGREWGEEESDEMPGDYMVQLQQYLEVFRAKFGLSPNEAPYGAVGLLLGGFGWRTYTSPWHEQLVGIIVDAGRQFWDSVLSGDMPPMPTNEHGLDLLKQLYPKEEVPGPVDIGDNPDFVDAGDRLEAAKLALKAASSEAIAAEVRFKELMAETGAVLTPSRGWKATWRKSKDRAKVKYDQVVDTLATRFKLPPDAVEKATEENTEAVIGPRVFRFTPTKEDKT